MDAFRKELDRALAFGDEQAVYTLIELERISVDLRERSEWCPRCRELYLPEDGCRCDAGQADSDPC